MDTLTAQRPELGNDNHDQLPGRPRRKLLTKLTLPLLGLLLAAGGFLGGIEVEKSHNSGSSTSALSSAASSLRSRFASGGFPGASTGSKSGGFPGGRAGFPGGGAFGGGGTTGTISSISGKSIVLKTTAGNSVTVKLTSATTVKKELRVKRGSIRPGDTITVDGITGKGGSIKASSISDSGASPSSSSSSSSGSS
jgi:Domain of unknown function (DUF5666)